MDEILTKRRHSSATESALDVLLVAGWPLFLGLHLWAIHSPNAVLVPGFEFLLVLAVTRRTQASGTPARRLSVLASVLFLGASALRTLPEIWSTPASVRYGTTEWLGATLAGFPVVSVFFGLLALGPAHLAARCLSERSASRDTTRTLIHDAYFGGTSLLATVAVAEYAGGPILL